MLRSGRLIISRIPRGHNLTMARSLTYSPLLREVQLFDMPSMSPTMEEGGICEWKFKPGDKFKAGDVLLDIETDKAEISVEAADDGVLAKILVEAGTKGIPVGKPIAVTAEEGDDINAIDYGVLLKGTEKPAAAENPAPAAEPAVEPATTAHTPNTESVAPTSHVSHGNHGLGPLPAALRLIHEHHLNASDIQGSGPFNRVTKGDVLAHLGKIPKEYPVSEQARIEKRQKLDLSNIQIAAAAASDAVESKPLKKEAEKPKPIVTSYSIPVDAAVVAKIGKAKQTALRLALLSLRPKPSVLRDATLDLLTAPTKPPFVVNTKVVVYRGKPVSLDVTVEEPPAPVSNKAVGVYIEALKSELAA